MKRPTSLSCLCTVMLLCGASYGQASVSALPRPDHVVIVMEENHAHSEILGSSLAPYINALARQGALFTRSFAIGHPSLPNYLALFSGSTQGIRDDSEPHSFTTPNLGASLIAQDLTFIGYGEDLPHEGSKAIKVGPYSVNHCPWVAWQSAATNGIPAKDNQPFSAFPSALDFASLPTVSIVSPNKNHDMHDGTITQGDAWLRRNIGPYVQWSASHNSLLIVTWDEDDNKKTLVNQITTIFVGAHVKVGPYAEHITHYNVLRTIEEMYGLPHLGHSAKAKPITDCWTTAAMR